MIVSTRFDGDAGVVRRVAVAADRVDVAAEHREVQHVGRDQRATTQEDQHRLGQQRDRRRTGTGRCRQRSRKADVAEAERAALGDGLRDAAEQQHAAQRDDERLKVKARDEQALGKPDEQRDAQRDGDANPDRVARGRPRAGEEILAMSTPVRPMIEPTDRSMPPVMMTKPMPIAKMPSMAIWRVVLSTLDCPRKSGLEMQRPRHMSSQGDEHAQFASQIHGGESFHHGATSEVGRCVHAVCRDAGIDACRPVISDPIRSWLSSSRGQDAA